MRNLGYTPVDDFCYSKPKQNSMGGQSLSINTENDNKIKIQTPTCYVPFGLNKYENDDGYSNYSVDVSLRNEPGMNEFIDYLESFDVHNKKQALLNCKEWFKKGMSEEIVTELYRPFLKMSQKYAPNIRYKINPKECNTFDTEGNAISFLDIKKGSKIKMVVELNGLYFQKANFGSSWKILEIEIQPEEKDPLTSYAFVED